MQGEIMANFLKAFEKTLYNEGGYKLHEIKNDHGGMTYAGIARRYHPYWSGWLLIDSGLKEPLIASVQRFYLKKFWNKIKGSSITDQKVAETLFDFAVNTGIKTASKIAQRVVEASPDGIIGSMTIAKINKFDSETFLSLYALAKIVRYANICNKNSSQKRFLLGWINRTLKGV
jgi:lysozyme family protein